MNKLMMIIILVVTSSAISAGLLFLGITMMGKYSPALASSLNALIARTNAQNSPNAIPVGDGVPLTMDLQRGEEKLKGSSASIAISAFPVGSQPLLKAQVNPISTEAPVAGVTIVQLLNNPAQFIHLEISITGIATNLGNDHFLLNDGTGQIIVELEDDLIGLVIVNGLSITVIGHLDDSSNLSSLVLVVSTFIDQNGNVFSDDCKEDDIGDDDCLDDSNDDQSRMPGSSSGGNRGSSGNASDDDSGDDDDSGNDDD
jgi:uncharacterized protein YdeI (BOF family)